MQRICYMYVCNVIATLKAHVYGLDLTMTMTKTVIKF